MHRRLLRDELDLILSRQDSKVLDIKVPVSNAGFESRTRMQREMSSKAYDDLVEEVMADVDHSGHAD